MLYELDKYLILEYFDFLDGKKTIYHGTSAENKKKIQQDGLQGSYSGKEGTVTHDILGDTIQGKDSRDKVFTTDSKWKAATYAASHKPDGTRVSGASPIGEQFGVLGKAAKNYITGNGVVKARLDKTTQRSEVLNPELKTKLDSRYGTQTLADQMAPQNMKSFVGNAMFGTDRVYKNDIKSSDISGGAGNALTVKQNFKNIKDNIHSKLNDSRYTKLRNKAQLGSNKTTRRNLRGGKNMAMGNAAINTALLGGIGYAAFGPDGEENDI